MLVSKDNLQLVLVDYINKVIVPKAEGWQKMGARGMSFLVANRLHMFVNDPETIKMLHLFGIMNQDGLVDMNFVKNWTLSMFEGDEKSPAFLGYMFDKSDIENLYSIATQFQHS